MFCGFPIGEIIPPKLEAMFCIMKVKARYSVLLIYFKTRYARGKNVRSAMSFALTSAEMYVMNIKARIILLVVLNFLTTNLATF